MRIGFFVSGFPVRSETFILTQIAGLLERGHEVEIWANALGDPEDLHEDFRHYRLFERVRCRRQVRGGSAARRFLARLRLLRTHWRSEPGVVLRALNVLRYGRKALSLDLLDMALCLRHRPCYDVVHCHFGPNGNDAALLMDLGVLSGRLATTFHSYDVVAGIETRGRVYRRLLRRADAVHSISGYNRRWLESFGFAPERIHYQPMAIDAARFPPREGGRTDGTIRVLTVARLAPEKGLPFALAAIAAMLRARPGLRLCYRIIGGGPLLDQLRTEVQKSGLDGVVELLGPQDQARVRAALAEADIFLLPSLQEALPIAIMEAMASGLPVVATDVGGVGELVRTGDTGRLVPPGDAQALEAALLHLIDAGEEERCRLGRCGRALVLSRHDRAAVVDRLIEHYKELTRGDGGIAKRDQARSVAYSRP